MFAKIDVGECSVNFWATASNDDGDTVTFGIGDMSSLEDPQGNDAKKTIFGYVDLKD